VAQALVGGLHVGSSCMSDHNRATPVAACVESVPNGERLGSGLTVPDRQSMNGIGRARLVGVDTRWKMVTLPMAHHDNLTLP
jgi:hypothetical protein